MVFNAIGVDPEKCKVVMGKGGSAAATLVAGGHITMGHLAVILALPHIQAGTIRPLAIIEDILKDQEYNDAMKKMLFYPFYHGPQEMNAYIENEMKIVRKVYGINK